MTQPDRRLVLAVLCATAADLAAIGLTATATWMIVRAAGHPPLAALSVAIVAVRTLAVVRGGLRYADRLLGHDAVLGEAGETRARTFRSLAARPHRHGGTALASVVTDVNDAQEFLLRRKLPRFSVALTSALTVAVTAVVSPVAGLVLAAGLAVTGLVLPRFVPSVPPSAHAMLSGYALDLTRGRDDLVVLGAFDRHRAEAASVSRAASQRQRVVTTRAAALTAVAILVQAATAVAVLVLAGAGTPIAAALALTALGAVELTLPLLEPIRRPPLSAPAEPEPQPPLTDEVRLDHVTARTLRDLSLTVHRGQRIAVVGPTGAGKSTLLDLMTGLLPPERGQVTGRATGNHDDAWVFAAPIHTNLRLANPTATEDDLRAALTTVGLAADLDADATALSGGQRQRLLLARALLADAPVLVLDEPVAALDPESADEVLVAALAKATGAVVLVSHRLAALAAVDEVVVLDQGKIIQRGPHATLAATPGLYRDALLIEQAATTG